MKNAKWIFVFLFSGIFVWLVWRPTIDLLGGHTLRRQPQELQVNSDGRISRTLGNNFGAPKTSRAKPSTATLSTHHSFHQPSSVHSPIEAALLHGQSISAEKAESLLTSNEFLEFMERLRTEAANDALAQEISSIYQKTLEAQLENPASALVVFRCGVTLCAGAVRESINSTDYRDMLRKFSDSGRPSIYSYTDYSILLSESEVEHRFIFSTDPDVASISAR